MGKYLWEFRCIRLSILIAVGALVAFVFYEPVRVEEAIGMVSKRAALAVVVGASVVWGAVLLYKVRCVNPKLYGAVEIGVGIFTAGFVAGNVFGVFSHTPFDLFGVAAAMYVIVRGLDNAYRGIEGNKRASWNRTFFGQDTDAKL